MAAEVNKDKKGTHWRVPPFDPKDVVKFKPISGIDVWWNRDRQSKADELLVLRQEWDSQAQVVMLTLGQVYDLIDALNKAVEGI